MCDYKSVDVSTHNGGDKELRLRYDFDQMVAPLMAKPEYKVITSYRGGRVSIYRTFGGVEYIFIFENYQGAVRFDLTAYNRNGGISNVVAKCTVPNYFIEKNIIQMIDDLALNSSQRAEVRESVRVRRVKHGMLSY